jgi:hypothetical protein
MSFLDDVVDFGSKIFNSVSSSNIASSIAKTAALGFLVNQVSNSVNKKSSLPQASQTSQPDRSVREQMSPDTNHSIPVVYGTGYIKGIITDAVMSNDNKTMTYCITICEKTGIKLSDSADSVITFDKIYLNSNEVQFNNDGLTVLSTTDEDGNTDNTMNGLIRIYCFNNGGSGPVVPTGYANGSLGYAYSVFPGWTANHTMTSTVFAIVVVEYNKEKNITSLGELEFKLTNSMTLPGDVLNDYMKSTRYGAGLTDQEIYSA